MTKQYIQLTIQERVELNFMLWDKLSIREIARRLNRNPSTISREIKRNTPAIRRRYTPHLAQEKYQLRKATSRQRPRLKDPKVVEYVTMKLKEDWSPEQIAGKWNKHHKKLTISHEAIYQYIYANSNPCDEHDLRPYLRRKHKRRHRKYIPFKTTKTTIPNRIPIDLRPREIEQRKIIGHWEGDSMVSRKSLAALNTLAERKSLLIKITKLDRKTKEETNSAVIKRLGSCPDKLRQTLTLDNGTENAGHEEITKTIKTKCYFAHAYHSWERGTNENLNGLIRQYFPKGTDFAKVTEAEIKYVENMLNNRPRKKLNYLTPNEVFNRAVALSC